MGAGRRGMCHCWAYVELAPLEPRIGSITTAADGRLVCPTAFEYLTPVTTMSLSFRHFIQRATPRTLRNWVRSPAKSIRYVVDRAAFAAGAAPTVSPAEGWSIRCHPAAQDYFQVFRDDPSQAEELRAFAAHCSRGMRLLDLGAHYGLFALAALHYGGPHSTVLCVDASPRAAGLLRANLALNSAESRVSVVHCAIGAEDGQLPMLTTGPLGGDYFVVPTEERKDTILVPQRSLPSLMAEMRFRPTHIKMDIEGSEFEVIQSGVGLLAGSKPVLFLELHGNFLRARGKDPAIVMANLRQAGYKTMFLGDQPVDQRDLDRCHYTCRLVCLA
jgi:FkbM family methyltransferase